MRVWDETGDCRRQRGVMASCPVADEDLEVESWCAPVDECKRNAESKRVPKRNQFGVVLLFFIFRRKRGEKPAKATATRISCDRYACHVSTHFYDAR